MKQVIATFVSDNVSRHAHDPVCNFVKDCQDRLPAAQNRNNKFKLTKILLSKGIQYCKIVKVTFTILLCAVRYQPKNFPTLTTHLGFYQQVSPWIACFFLFTSMTVYVLGHVLFLQAHRFLHQHLHFYMVVNQPGIPVQYWSIFVPLSLLMQCLAHFDTTAVANGGLLLISLHVVVRYMQTLQFYNL